MAEACEPNNVLSHGTESRWIHPLLYKTLASSMLIATPVLKISFLLPSLL